MQNTVDSAPSTVIVKQLHPVLESIRAGQNPSLQESAQASYRGMLGYYSSQLKRIGISSEQLVAFANSYSKQTGLVEVPILLKRTALNMGLYGVAGIVCDDAGKKASGGGSGGGGRGPNTRTGPRRSNSNSSSNGYQNAWPPRKEFGSPRTAGGNAREGDRRTSTPRNDNNMTTPWRSSAPKKPFGIKRTTSRDAPTGDQRWYGSFRDRNTTPPPPKKENILGKSEKWNRRRGKSEWVDREE
jgi:hypothetical protein